MRFFRAVVGRWCFIVSAESTGVLFWTPWAPLYQFVGVSGGTNLAFDHFLAEHHDVPPFLA